MKPDRIGTVFAVPVPKISECYTEPYNAISVLVGYQFEVVIIV